MLVKASNLGLFPVARTRISTERVYERMRTLLRDGPSDFETVYMGDLEINDNDIVVTM